MKLYFHPASPNVRAVFITAALLDVPLEKCFVDAMAGDQHKADYLALNPNGLFPVLIDGDFVLWETVAIMQYLASNCPGNLLFPGDARSRANISRWQCWSLAHWSPALRTYIFENLFKKMKGLGEADPVEIKKGEESYHRHANVLDQHLANRDYMVGKGLTLADISVASNLMYAQPAQVPLEEYTHIRRWFAQIEALPAWQQTQP
jgi:glutathione S-transferase